MDARFAWLLHVPALLVPVALWLRSASPAMPTNKLLLTAFTVHYAHRYTLQPSLSGIDTERLIICTVRRMGKGRGHPGPSR